MTELGVKSCPNCGGPLKDGNCEYCKSPDWQKRLIQKTYERKETCRNCGAEIRFRLSKGWLVCAYCAWPFRKPILIPLRKIGLPRIFGIGGSFCEFAFAGLIGKVFLTNSNALFPTENATLIQSRINQAQPIGLAIGAGFGLLGLVFIGAGYALYKRRIREESKKPRLDISGLIIK